MTNASGDPSDPRATAHAARLSQVPSGATMPWAVLPKEHLARARAKPDMGETPMLRKTPIAAVHGCVEVGRESVAVGRERVFRGMGYQPMMTSPPRSGLHLKKNDYRYAAGEQSWAGSPCHKDRAAAARVGYNPWHPARSSLKNIQVFDAAQNAVYDIFAATDEEFALIFPDGQDVAFIGEVIAASRRRRTKLNDVLRNLWTRRLRKCDAMGIHGLLFYELDVKKQYYPTRRDEDAINPNGTRLR